jgi:hypothetical protein
MGDEEVQEGRRFAGLETNIFRSAKTIGIEIKPKAIADTNTNPNGISIDFAPKKLNCTGNAFWYAKIAQKRARAAAIVVVMKCRVVFIMERFYRAWGIASHAPCLYS